MCSWVRPWVGLLCRDPIAGSWGGVFTYCAGASVAPIPDHGTGGGACLHMARPSIFNCVLEVELLHTALS